MYYLTNIQLFQLVKSFPYHRTIDKTTKIYLSTGLQSTRDKV